MALLSVLLAAVSLVPIIVDAQSYTATYLPSNAPNHTESGQQGTNKCGTSANPTSMCQNAYVNSVDDFCLWAPPRPGAGSTIGDTEQYEVSWCLRDGYGTRLMPNGTIKGAHFVQTPDFVQITGTGDLTKLNIPKGDEGGELDPHGADGNGNPVGGLVFSNAFGTLEQIHEWTNYMSDTEFCFRACKPGPKARTWCQHIYDEQGCEWNMPANYDAGVFEQCQADSGLPMGIYGSSTYRQGHGPTPPPHPVPKSSSCTSLTTVGNGPPISSSIVSTTPAATTTSFPVSSATSLSSKPTGPAGNSSAAISSASIPGWERLALVCGTLLFGSLLGTL